MNILNKRRLLPLGLISLLFCSAPVMAQNNDSDGMVVVTGYVSDAALGSPMAGVKVQAYNNALYSTMTKENGTYSLRVPEYVASLTFSLEGCNTIVRSLNGRQDGIDVKMYSDEFSEIYSGKTTGSNSVVAGLSGVNADLSVDNQIQQSLQGSVYSLTRSGQIGVGIDMQIDGVSSLNINTQPLIVLDGVFLDNGFEDVSMHSGFYNNILANIPVEDIESVSVIRNGYGIYGPKGANGVILINTKRNKSMATKIDVNLSGNFQLIPKTPVMMNASEYRNYASELLGSTGAKINTFKFLQTDDSYYYYKEFHNDTDWKDVSYQNAFIQNYNVNVQGGDDIANYNLSVGYAMGDATIKNNSYDRFSLRLNSDIILSNNLSLRFDASYSDVNRNMRDDGVPADIDNTMINSPAFLSLIKAPFLAPYEYDKNHMISQFIAKEDNYLDEVIGTEVSLANPLAILVDGEGINKNAFGNRLITMSVTPKWDFNRYFSLSEHFTYTLANADENYFIPTKGTPKFKIEGIGTVENKVSAMNAKKDGFMSDTYLSFARRFKAHDVNAQAGFRYINNSMILTSMEGYNSGNDKTPNMTNSLKFKKTDGSDATDISLTWWAQGNYNYREKYYVSAALGISSSSRFGGDVSNGLKLFGVPWGLFPSISGSWIVSSEPWFKVPMINYLKLNAGFDLTGNDGFDDSAAKTYFYPVKVVQMQGVALSNIGNNSLQWETTKKLTAGLDMNMFNNKLSLSANMFYSVTDNLLSISSLSYLTGIPNSWSNGGSLSNVGFDVVLNGKLINTNMVKWEAGASIGHYTNKVTKLPDGRALNNTYLDATIRTQEGSPVGIFYGYKTNGVFATTEEAVKAGYKINTVDGDVLPVGGDVRFVDTNQDGILDSKDMVQIGDPNPKFYGRLFTKLSVSNFTLSATFTYSLGGDIYNYERMILESGSRFMNQTVAVTNRWATEGQIADIPRLSYGDPHGNSRFSDRWIEDGSYLRLKNVTLSYKIPMATTYLQGITIWGSANNLFTLTKYLGSDPEFSTSNDILTRGIDRGLLPQSTNFSLGLKINL